MSTDFTVGDLVAEFLPRCGVETVFGIVSIHNIPMLDAIGRRNAIRFVMARGEMGGTHMADGNARASGGLGVIFSSTGPGAANAVPGLVEARFAGTPVLHITGATPTKYSDREVGAVHDIPDQLGMMASVSKSAYRVRTAQEALGVLTRAAVDALTPPQGPVSLEIPIDLQTASIPRPEGLDDFVLPLPAPRAPRLVELNELASRVRQAKRPLLWIGSGARNAGDAALRLLAMGFGMVSSLAGRGIVPEDHAMNLGAFTGNGIPAVQEFYGTCDLMIVVGSRLRAHETGDHTLRLPENLIQVDIDPLANGRTYANRGFVCADARATIEGLADRLSDYVAAPELAEDLASLRQRLRAAYARTLGPYEIVPARLREAVPDDAVWARDITISNSTWGNRLFTLFRHQANIYPVSAGIGQGMPLGLGAAFAAGERRTVILTGDGGFFLNMGEFWTAVQERLNVVLLVMNDRGYGVIRQIQDAKMQGRHYFTDLAAPDLEGLAALAGVPFRRASRAEEIATAVGELVALSGPSIVEADMTAIGAHPPYFPYAPAIEV